MINFNNTQRIIGRDHALSMFRNQLPRKGDTVWLHSGGDACSEKVRSISIGKDDIFIEIERARLTLEGERYSRENKIYYNSHANYSYKDLSERFPTKFIEYISISAEYFSKPSNWHSNNRFGRITKDSLLIFLGMEDEHN